MRETPCHREAVRSSEHSEAFLVFVWSHHAMKTPLLLFFFIQIVALAPVVSDSQAIYEKAAALNRQASSRHQRTYTRPRPRTPTHTHARTHIHPRTHLPPRTSHIHPPPTDVRTHTQHAHPQHGFVILQLLNVGYLQMTLSWLCNLQMVADAGTSNAMNVRLYLTFVARQDKTT